MTVELVRFPLANYTNQIVLTDKDIQEYYDQNQSRYGLPEREQINYIQFNLTNYLAIADQMLAGTSNFDANSTRCTPANPGVLQGRRRQSVERRGGQGQNKAGYPPPEAGPRGRPNQRHATQGGFS